MRRLASRVNGKGQVVLPKLVREGLVVGAGDVVEFVPTSRGVLVRRRVGASPFEKYRGVLGGKDVASLIEQLRGR